MISRIYLEKELKQEKEYHMKKAEISRVKQKPVGAEGMIEKKPCVPGSSRIEKAA
jgi:hypothetical protein